MAEPPRLLPRRSAGFVHDCRVGAGGEQRTHRGRAAEIDGRRVHQRRVTRLVPGVDVNARAGQFRNHIGAVRDGGPMEEVDAGALDEMHVGAGRDQRADDIGSGRM